MLTSTSTATSTVSPEAIGPSPEAIRQRRYRRREREGLSLPHSEVPWRVIEALIDGGWLTEDQTANSHLLGEAMLKVVEKRVRSSEILRNDLLR